MEYRYVNFTSNVAILTTRSLVLQYAETYHWKSMAIPSKSSIYMISTLMCPAGYNIFSSPGQYVTIMWQPSRKRRAIVKYVPANNLHVGEESRSSEW